MTDAKSLWRRLRQVGRDDRGASMVEYAVALLVVVGVGVATMTSLGTKAGANVTSACTVVNKNTAC